MDKFLNYMKLNDEEDEGFYDDDYLDDEEEVEPVKSSALPRTDSRHRMRRLWMIRESVLHSPRLLRFIVPLPSKMPGTGMEVCVIKPTSVEDAREITETLLANRTVVLNLEGLDVDIAQRIIDFTSGSCFAVNGNLQKVSNYIFIVTPSNVDISGDFQNIMSAFEASSLQSDI